MEENTIQELQDLTKLAEAGSLADDQKPRFNELKAMDLEEKVKKFDEERKTLLAQKDHFRTKHEELEKKYKEIEAKLPKDSQPVATDPLTLMKTVSILKDFNQDELDIVSTFAKGKGCSLEEAAKDQTVQLAVGALREKAKKEAAIPTPQYSGVTFNKKPVGELSDKEVKENWSEIVNGVLKNKKGGTL